MNKITMAATSAAARLHANLIKSNNPDHALYNNLITLYSSSHLPSALLLFRHLPFPPSAVSWTAIISAHSHSPSAALRLLLSMLRRPSLPSAGTLSSILKILSSSSSPFSHLTPALSLHALAIKLSLHRLPFAGSALVHFYSKAHRPEDALRSFHEISNKDDVCYGAAVVGLAQNARPADALSLFAALRSAAVPSSPYTLSAALRAAAQAAALEQARLLHAHAVVSGLDSGVIVGTSLVDAYGKTGLVIDARNVFYELSVKANLVTYNAMLAAYAQQGDSDAAIALFDKMIEGKFSPDELTFLAILTAFSNAGLVKDTEIWLDLMKTSYGVNTRREHYTCLVGVLARVGRLEDAYRFALAMPFEPDAAVWRTLLSGCMVHGAVELGQTAGEQLLALDLHDDSAYVMLANIYSAAGRKSETADVLRKMRDRGVKKEGGRSWVEMKGEVHMFVSRDQRHERTNDVYTKLMELVEEVRKLGYEEVDEAVLYHSERLAVAFAVLNGAALDGKVLRVIKNLRICRDCHEFFKYLSQAMKREIVVRDVNRYHRFQHGSCTCRDYW